MSTYGVEFVAARTCIEHIIYIRTTLRYLAFSIIRPSQMFGDNKSATNSSVHIHEKLHKSYNYLSFHRIRESIAAGSFHFHHLSWKYNPVDVLNKYWSQDCAGSLLHPLIVWERDKPDIQAGAWSFNFVEDWHNIFRIVLFCGISSFCFLHRYTMCEWGQNNIPLMLCKYVRTTVYINFI